MTRTLDLLREILSGQSAYGMADISSTALEGCLFALAVKADAELAQAIADELAARKA